jgi:hypothetical protein
MTLTNSIWNNWKIFTELGMNITLLDTAQALYFLILYNQNGVSKKFQSENDASTT